MDVRLYGPGEVPEEVRGGDVLLVRSGGLFSRFVRLMDGGDFSHAAICVGGNGTIVEATRRGVERRHVSDWRDATFALVRPGMAEEDRRDAVRQAERIAGSGWRYDLATLLFTPLFWLTGGRVMVSAGAKAAICSGLVADCLHAGGEWFPEKSPFFMTPADLQRHFGVGGVDLDPMHGTAREAEGGS